jgi:threonine/homoserine/homoserine lactone efflux protein
MAPGLDSLLVLRTAAYDGARAAMITGCCMRWKACCGSHA